MGGQPSSFGGTQSCGGSEMSFPQSLKATDGQSIIINWTSNKLVEQCGQELQPLDARIPDIDW